MSDDSVLSYRKVFDPPLVEGHRRSDGIPDYDYTEQAVLTINVAMATRRPVLVRGLSGTGKSSMSRDVAKVLGWDHEHVVIDSRTTAQDLRWRVDLVERLAEAQLGAAATKPLDIDLYLHPGVMWWAFEPASASSQFERATGSVRHPERASESTVVLLDEIDKADPDLPNGLLEVLEEGTFSVDGRAEPVRRPVTGSSPLVFVTTNSERRLPDAFLRRCLELELTYPDRERMRSIAAVRGVADRFDEVWSALFGDSTVMTISPAELLDTLRAFEHLDDGTSGLLERLAEVTAWKRALGRTTASDEADDW